MDALQERLARIALETIGDRGFVLGGGKMDALFNRWAPRDFLDVDAILMSGRYDRQELEAGALEHNPGFNRAMFAESLAFLTRIPDREFEAYGADHDQITAMRARFAKWRSELTAPE